MDIKEVKPQIWNFKVLGGEKSWEEVAYSAKMSGVPEHVKGEDIFKMIIDNDYGSSLEHVIIKFDIKITKGSAPELLEHRMSSHTGWSTRYIQANQGIEKETPAYEIIVPWHLLGEKNKEKKGIFLERVRDSLEKYEEFINDGLPRESARYLLPFCQAVGIYHFTMNLRSFLNLLSLRLCVRVAPEFRCITSQLYFLLEKELPIMEGVVGCRGYMGGVCPESNVIGVREGEQHPVYPPCPFRNPSVDTFIPTKKEVTQGIDKKEFNRKKAVNNQKLIFKKWAAWEGD